MLEALLAAVGTPVSDYIDTDSDEVVELMAVVTQPDRTHRGKTITNPIAAYAIEHGILTLTPERLRKDADIIAQLDGADMAIVASYGQIIPKTVLEVPKHGFINWHPSRLPKYRGPTPLQSAIRDGLDTTALTWIVMNEAMDAGDIISQHEFELTEKTFSTAIDEAGQLGAATMWSAIESKIKGKHEPQNEDEASYCKMLSKGDGIVDLDDVTAKQLQNHFRAYRPWPGTRVWMSFSEQPELDCQYIKLTEINLNQTDFTNVSEVPLDKEIFTIEVNGEAKSYLQCIYDENLKSDTFLEIKKAKDENGRDLKLSSL